MLISLKFRKIRLLTKFRNKTISQTQDLSQNYSHMLFDFTTTAIESRLYFQDVFLQNTFLIYKQLFENVFF